MIEDTNWPMLDTPPAGDRPRRRSTVLVVVGLIATTS
jgi:hypothetical protein